MWQLPQWHRPLEQPGQPQRASEAPMSDARKVATWLSDLGNLTAGAAPLADAKAKIGAMTAALSEEFDPSTFNHQSLLFVARRCKFFPTFGEACDALSEWREQNPRHLAIEDHSNDQLDPESRSWLAYYRKQEAAGFPRGQEHAQSLLERYAPGAARVLGI